MQLTCQRGICEGVWRLQRAAKLLLVLLLHLPDLLVVEVVHERALYWVSVWRAGVDVDHLGVLLHRHGASLPGVHGLDVEVEFLEVVEILLVLRHPIVAYVALLLESTQALE